MKFEEPKEGDTNNDYPSKFNKGKGEAREMSNGMGIEKGGDGLNDFAGSEAGERDEYLKREVARFDELRSKAFGRDIPITNAGIVLDSFGGAYGETGSPINRGKDEDTKGEQED
jgi:hypothetical protein